MSTATSNARPIAIFTGYMVLALALTVSCISIIRRGAGARRSSNSNRVILFTILAAFSLATTWYHMFQFFAWSYRQWAVSAATAPLSGGLRLGDWLRDTTLFEQAWASTLETPTRAWWSMQIFGFCALLSVMLPLQKDKRRLPSAWTFMLLGQVVAISFASNLFFLAVLTRDVVAGPAAKVASKATATRSNKRDPGFSISSDQLYNFMFVLQILVAISVPRVVGSPNFLRLLLAPHILAFVPLLLRSVVPHTQQRSSSKRVLSLVPVGSLAALLVAATAPLFREGVNQLPTALATLYEHPAVSSVGWDVICCWVSFTAWFVTGGEGI